MNPPLGSVRIAALLIVLALAGCLGGGDGEGGGDGDRDGDRGDDDGNGGTPPPPDDGTKPPRDPPGPNPDTPAEPLALLTGFDYTDCAGLEVRFQPSLDAAQDVLPEGYEALAVDGPIEQRADVEYVFARCDGFSTLSSAFNDTMFGHLAIRIEPPADAGDADEHWYRVTMFAEPGLMTLVWEQAGYDVYTANLTRPETPVGTSIAFDGYDALGLATTDASSDATVRAHHTVTDDGVLEWTGTFESTGMAMHGTFSVPDDDPLADAWEDRTAPTAFTLYEAAQWTDNDLWLVRS